MAGHQPQEQGAEIVNSLAQPMWLRIGIDWVKGLSTTSTAQSPPVDSPVDTQMHCAAVGLNLLSTMSTVK